MHDVIRDMALWLVCGDRRDKFLIQLLNSINAHRIERWEEAERIPVCPKLSTLLVKDTEDVLKSVLSLDASLECFGLVR